MTLGNYMSAELVMLTCCLGSTFENGPSVNDQSCPCGKNWGDKNPIDIIDFVFR